MSFGYTKLFESILDSTIWRADNETRIVWITMLAMKNQYHIVNSSIPGLADRARVPIEAVEKALEKFMSPDKYSSSQDYEGRRIKKVEGGWFILNGKKYEEKLRYEKRKAYNRMKQDEYRKRKKGLGPTASEIMAIKFHEEHGMYPEEWREQQRLAEQKQQGGVVDNA